MKLSPWFVVVDTEILVKAPSRFFVAGIGDAMATKFEAEASAFSGANNYFEGQVSQTALALANLSWEIIKDKALAALEAVYAGMVNQAFEDVVEATILLSGFGFKNGGLAAAHAISSGFTVLEPPASEKLIPAIKAICASTSTIHSMPFEIKTEMVERAILKADLLGRGI